MEEHYKAINFDLDTNALKLYYPGKEYNKAYYDIRRFMEQNGFSHRQGSGYRSIEQLSDFAVNDLVEELFKEFDWLFKCTKRLDATNIEKTMICLKPMQEKERLQLERIKTLSMTFLRKKSLNCNLCCSC